MTQPNRHQLLVVDDEPDLRTLYELTLLREGYDVETAESVGDAWSKLQDRRFDVVITDMRLPDGTGLELLKRLEAEHRAEQAIVITAYGSAENAVEALKAGAYDYLTKPVDLRQFRSAVSSAASQARPVQLASELPQPKAPTKATRQDRTASTSALARMAGQAPAMQHVRSLIDKVARSMAPVLVSGESGTGKELVARSIHEASSRASGAFIAVNCGAIPEHLLEAEFFGYRKGAFTGATEDREGFFQAAHGGTLFLDEIGDLPLSMQSKLLRVIQERAVRPIGAINEAAVDVRILSATHKNLSSEVAAGRFRQDLFYRLNVIRIELPALRDRREDLPDLVQRILTRIASESHLHTAPQVSPAALTRLLSHDFPGNVRELENILHRAVTLSGHETIEAEDLSLDGCPKAVGTARVSATPAIEPVVEAPAIPAQVSPQDSTTLPCDLVAHLDQVEREILVQALEKHKLNRTAAGASLNLSLRQMRYRMARLGIHITDQGLFLGERFDPDADAE